MRLKEPTKICKICFKEFKVKSLRTLCFKNITICDDCFNKLKPRFIRYKIYDIKALALYEYDEQFKTLLFQYKGCYDYQLFNVFLEQFSAFLRIYYSGYTLVPIPSNEVDDERREYNHVVEAFSVLKLPIIHVLYKSELYKQSDQKRSDRNNIHKILKMSDIKLVKNKKILLVDDVCTTGSSLRAAIKLIRKGHPKTIRIFALSKVVGH